MGIALTAVAIAERSSANGVGGGTHAWAIAVGVVLFMLLLVALMVGVIARIER